MASKSPDEPPWTAVNSAGFIAPAALSADVVVLPVRDRLSVLLTRSSAGWSLPGGFVGPEESTAVTARRKLMEKTGLGAELYLEQLASFSDPGRDPRGWIPTVAYLALVPADVEPPDPAASWHPVEAVPALRNDHAAILEAAVERVHGKLWWSNVAVGILPGDFTLAEARAVYDAIAGTAYDPSTFSRDLRATGLVEPAGAARISTRGRPAALYRFCAHVPSWGAGRRKRVARG